MLKILSIDGGGVGGIIPTRILENLESRLPKDKPLRTCFDIIAGVSAGGLLGIMLSTPNPQTGQYYTASFIASRMASLIQSIFKRSLWSMLRSGAGLLDSFYDADVIKAQLKAFLGDTQLSQVTNELLILSYDLERDETCFFNSGKLKGKISRDCYLHELAYATMAVPLYFRPAFLKDLTNNKTLALVDGGVSTTNPTLAALIHAIQMTDSSLLKEEILIVSLGTGTHRNTNQYKVIPKGAWHWGKELAALLMHAGDTAIDYEVKSLLNNTLNQHYFRFQPILPSTLQITDRLALNSNMALWEDQAKQLIQARDADLQYIAKILASDE